MTEIQTTTLTERVLLAFALGVAVALMALSLISCTPAPKKRSTIHPTRLTLEQLHYEMEHQPGMDVIKGAEAITNYRLK